MRYLAFITSAGAPAEGLTPTIAWRRVDGSSAGSAPTIAALDSMPGWYYFEAEIEYPTALTIDGGASLADVDRYIPMVLGPDDFLGTNKRIVYTDHDVRGNPTAGRLLLYDSAEAMAADVDPWTGASQSWAFTTVYDDNAPLVYEQEKEAG